MVWHYLPYCYCNTWKTNCQCTSNVFLNGIICYLLLRILEVFYLSEDNSIMTLMSWNVISIEAPINPITYQLEHKEKKTVKREPSFRISVSVGSNDPLDWNPYNLLWIKSKLTPVLYLNHNNCLNKNKIWTSRITNVNKTRLKQWALELEP